MKTAMEKSLIDAEQLRELEKENRRLKRELAYARSELADFKYRHNTAMAAINAFLVCASRYRVQRRLFGWKTRILNLLKLIEEKHNGTH